MACWTAWSAQARPAEDPDLRSCGGGVAGGGGQCGIEGFESGGQRVEEGDVVAAGWGGHGDVDADAGAGADVPGPVVVAADVVGVVDGVIGAGEVEAAVTGA